ncbi:hypothetical protein D3C79_455990 [compost metagenome]
MAAAARPAPFGAQARALARLLHLCRPKANPGSPVLPTCSAGLLPVTVLSGEQTIAAATRPHAPASAPVRRPRLALLHTRPAAHCPMASTPSAEHARKTFECVHAPGRRARFGQGSPAPGDSPRERRATSLHRYLPPALSARPDARRQGKAVAIMHPACEQAPAS